MKKAAITAAPDVRKGDFVNKSLRELRALQAALGPLFQTNSDKFWDFAQFMARLDTEIQRRTS
jgi:hypothetical protein